MADDDDDDAYLVQWAVKKMGRFELIRRERDGDDIIRYLAAQVESGPLREPKRPQLLLLDLKMPRMDGFEVLQWLIANPIEELVVAVLTGSLSREDMARALQLGAHYYQQKSTNPADYITMLRQFELYLQRYRAG